MCGTWGPAVAGSLAAIRRNVLPKLVGFDRQRTLRYLLAHLPASQALAELRRDLDGDTYFEVSDCFEAIVEVRPPTSTEALEMLAALPGKSAALKLVTAILGRDDATAREDYASLRQLAWETVLEGAIREQSLGDVFKLSFVLGRDGGVDGFDTDVFGVLFALLPERMTSFLAQHAATLPEAKRVTFAIWTNEITEAAVPHLLRHNPDWLLPRVPTLFARLPEWRADRVVAGIVNAPNAADALTALAFFPWPTIEDAVTRVLEAAPEGSQTRDCLGILLQRHLPTAEDAAAVLKLCLHYAEKAGYDRLELSVAMAQHLAEVLESSGAASAREGVGFATLLAIARGETSDAEEQEAADDGDPLDGLDDATRRKIATLERMIKEYAAVGGDTGLFEAERTRLLGSKGPASA